MTSKEECEKAAKQLNLTDTTADNETTKDWPPYCYFIQQKKTRETILYFNNRSDSGMHCKSAELWDGRECICKEGKVESFYSSTKNHDEN